MANGRIVTGFSKPYVALYSASGTTITYSNGQILARGVDVSIEPEVGDDNNFYADNQIAENVAGTFNGGTLTLTVDGLLTATEKMLYGLPAPTPVTVGTETVNVTDYGDSAVIPYVGVGFVVRYQSDGVISYVPVVIPKVRFELNNTSAATQEDSVDWQTDELTAQIFRSDDANHTWQRKGEGQTTEAAAEAAVKAMLQIS